MVSEEVNMRFDAESSYVKPLSFYELHDVEQFAEYVEKQVSSMEQAGWFSRDNRMRGWIVELRKNPLEKEISSSAAWSKSP